MMNFLIENQISILSACSIMCIILGIYVLVIRFQSVRKKLALVKIEFGVAALTAAQAIGYLYEGQPGNNAYWALRAANLIVFIFTPANIYFLNEYIVTLFMETGRFETLPKRLRAAFIILSVGMGLVVVSQFTGMYYYIDSDNIYHRGPLFMVSFLFPFFTAIMLFGFVLQYSKLINKRIFWAIIVFSILPISAGVFQAFVYGFSFLDVAIFMAAVTLFGCALSDQNDELTKAVNTDPATGLPNGFGYEHELEKIIHFQNITDYCGYYFDIVRMGNYNTRYGKKYGDVIIAEFGYSIRRNIDKDELLGRLGGNFFVALIKKSNTEKFLELLGGVPVEFDFLDRKERIRVAAVAGGYEIKRKNVTVNQIMGNTSVAVNYAKNVAHKPYVFMDEDLEDVFKRTRALEERTRIALKQSEFEPFYQPKVNAKDNVLFGAEALVRWRNNGQLIPPAEFIPVMENNGSVCDLDFCVLEHVCRDIRDWLDRGLEPVRISVNLSRKNLGNPILAEAVSNVVEKYNIPKDLVQIEITETLDEFPMDYLIGVVEALQRYGMTVAIDDFGTGSSSIGLLKQVKFDVLKIDKTFVDYKNDTEKQLLEDIIRMAGDIGIDVIAEGVEEKNQVTELLAMGCFDIQGYVFDRPIPKSDFEERLIKKKYDDK